MTRTEADLARREGRSYEPASALLERIREERTHQRLLAGRKRGRAPRQLRLST